MKYYLAYGSNLNLHAMTIRCKGAKVISRSVIKDYKLVFKGSCDGCSYLTLEKAEGKVVPVAVYKISFFDELALNKYEGYPHLYYKKKVMVDVNGKLKKAMVYIMRDKFDYHMPSKDYFEVCIEGYEDFSFNPKYLEEALETTNQNLLEEIIT